MIVDHILKDRLVDHFEFSIAGQGHVSCYSLVLFSEGQPVHLPNHVDKLFRVVHLDVTEEVPQEVQDRH